MPATNYSVALGPALKITDEAGDVLTAKSSRICDEPCIDVHLQSVDNDFVEVDADDAYQLWAFIGRWLTAHGRRLELPHQKDFFEILRQHPNGHFAVQQEISQGSLGASTGPQAAVERLGDPIPGEVVLVRYAPYGGGITAFVVDAVPVKPEFTFTKVGAEQAIGDKTTCDTDTAEAR